MEITSAVIFRRTLKSNEKTNIRLVTGWEYDTNFQNNLLTTNRLLLNSAGDPGFREKWAGILPVFKDEKDSVLRREMAWNAYNLEAMAKYNSYFDETFISQGMAYDFQWGMTGATRDLLFFSLPVSYYNPALAKSIIRLVSKNMLPSGELPYALKGFALNTNEGFSPSDFQLDFFWAVANYLKVTADFSILNETSSYYPKGSSEPDLISKLEKAFVYLRDEINAGSHGIIRLLNSDWNDQIWSNYSLSIHYWVAESHYNSALALYSLNELLNAFSLLPQNFNANQKLRIEKLTKDIQLFRTQQLKAFMQDMGERIFPRRVYINNDIVMGNDFMHSETVGITLLIPELGKERKTKLMEEAEKRLLNGELLGPRLSDIPIEKDKNFLKGTRENAGVWCFTGAIMTLGFAEVDESKALKMLKMKTFNNAAINYPNYWSGQWTNPDCTNSSLAKYPGLPDDNQFSPCIKFPAYCSHAHSWPLYLYYKLKSTTIRKQ